MSDLLFAEVNKLRNALIEINNNELLSPSSNDLNDVSFSQKIFVNPALLPASIDVTKETVASQQELEVYSAKVMQAVWNIAFHATGFFSVYYNRKTITQSFNFLDENKWVPKIVDKKTYEIGKALQAFLVAVSQDEVINSLPEKISFLLWEQEVRGEANKFISPLKDKLDKRLAIYETHSPEKIAEIKAIFALKMQRAEIISDSKLKFEKTFNETVNYFFQIEHRMKSPVINLEELKQVKETLAQKLEQLKQEYESFNLLNEKWHRENEGEFNINDVQRKLPKSVTISMPILTLLEMQNIPPDLAIQDWKNLFNPSEAGEVSLSSMDIVTSLVRTYKEGKNFLSGAQNLEQAFPQLQHQVEEQLQVVENIQPYVAQLQTAVVSALGIEAPSFYNDSKQQPESSKACELMIDAMKKYLSGFQESVSVAHDNFAQNNIPEKKGEGQLYDNAYSKAVTEAKEQLLMRKGQKITEIKAHITELQEKQKELEATEARESAKNREVHLHKLGNKIKTLDTQRAEADKLEIHTKLLCATFFENHYQPAINEIQKRYEAILEKFVDNASDTLNNMQQENYPIVVASQAEERQKFLKRAQEALNVYKKILDEPTGIYIPKEKIPQEQLKQFLETDKKWIDDLYAQEKAASGFLGIRTNMANYWNHYTSWFAPSDFDWDFNTITDEITKKLDQINEELTINIVGEATSLSQPQMLATNNLYTLQKKYQLQQQLKEEIAGWDKKKKSFDQNEAHAVLRSKLAGVYHDQAVIEEMNFKVDCRFFEIEQAANQILNEITQALVTLDGAAALEYLDNAQSRIAAINFDTLHKFPTSDRESSSSNLKHQIKDLIEVKRKEWDRDILDLLGKIETVSEDLQQLKEEAAAHFVAIEEQKSRLTQVKKALILEIAAKKSNFILLRQLAEIQLEVTQLIERRDALTANDHVAKAKLIKDIEAFEIKIANSINELALNKNSAVKEKLITTTNRIKALAAAKTTLQVELLNSIEIESLKLNNRAQDLASVNPKARSLLALEITTLQTSVEDFLKDITQSETGTNEVQLSNILSLVKALTEIREIIIPTFNQLDILHEDYNNLLEKADLLSKNSLGPALELLAKADELFVISKPTLVITEAHSLFVGAKEKFNRVTEAQGKLKTLKEEYVKIYTEQPSRLLNEIQASYQKLVARYNALHRYHEKDKKQLYKDIVQFERSALYSTFEQMDEGIFTESEYEQLKLIKQNQQQLLLFKELNTPQSAMSIRLFGVENLKDKFIDARAYLNNKYFGKPMANFQLAGFFGKYLEDRAKTFRLRDLISALAALTFGCLGYKTEAQQRKEYLEELRTAFQDYKDDPVNFKQLLDKIDKGEKFKPRSQTDDVDYDQTLQFHLAEFRNEVETLHEQLTDAQQETLQVRL